MDILANLVIIVKVVRGNECRLQGRAEVVCGYKLGRIRGSVLPALVSCQVKTIRWMTVSVATTEITQSAGAMRLNKPPSISRTMRSGRSMNPTLQSGIRDSALARE